MHWVGILNLEKKQIITSDTKENAIFQLSVKVAGHEKIASHTVIAQLRGYKESLAVAYDSEGEEIAKVFKCNCGSIKKHLEMEIA